jgi:ribosomal protein S12
MGKHERVRHANEETEENVAPRDQPNERFQMEVRSNLFGCRQDKAVVKIVYAAKKPKCSAIARAVARVQLLCNRHFSTLETSPPPKIK